MQRNFEIAFLDDSELGTLGDASTIDCEAWELLFELHLYPKRAAAEEGIGSNDLIVF